MALLNSNKKKRPAGSPDGRPAGLRRFKGAVVVLTIIWMTGFLVFPGLGSLPTTGPYAVRSEKLVLVDQTRQDPFCKEAQWRSLPVSLYYPDIPSGGMDSCPLVLFSHGGVSVGGSNLSLYRELASHGYVVAAVSHPGHALNARVQGRTIWIDPGYFREIGWEDADRDPEASLSLYRKWMDLRTGDISFVLDSLLEETAAMQHPGLALVDPDRIGLAGHSLGGSACLGAARMRGDVLAVAALESPFLCDIAGVEEWGYSWVEEPFPCPVLNVYSDSGYPLLETEIQYARNLEYLGNREWRRSVYIEGSNHYTLTDLVRTSPLLCAVLGGFYDISGEDSLTRVNQACLEFFDEFLKAGQINRQGFHRQNPREVVDICRTEDIILAYARNKGGC